MIVNQEKYLKYDIIEFDSVDSTMNVIKDYPFNTIINAREQTAGRGKGNRNWNSENNGNLYPTIKIEMNNKNLDYNLLVFVVNISLRETFEKYNKTNNKIVSKWPNDVLINDKKVSGTLLEITKKSLIIGVGINIETYPNNVILNKLDSTYMATSLKENNIIINKYEILKLFLKNFNDLKEEWEKNGFKTIKNKFLIKSHKFNEEIEVNGKIGIFKNLDENGNLILENKDGKFIYISTTEIKSAIILETI